MSNENGWGEDLDMYSLIKGRPSPFKRQRASHIYPSSASIKIPDNVLGGEKVIGGCMRKQYLQYKQEPSSDGSNDLPSLGVGEMGNFLQDFIENRFKEAGFFLQSELAVYFPEYNASGRIDTILYQVLDDGNYKFFGCEIKSKDGFYASNNYIDPPKRLANPTDFRPSDENIMQSIIYLHKMLTDPAYTKYKIDKWYLVYVDRSNGNFNWFEIGLTDENYKDSNGVAIGYGYPIIYSKIFKEGFLYKRFRIQDILDRWGKIDDQTGESLNGFLNRNELPPREYINAYSPAKWDQLNSAGLLNKADTANVKAGQYHKIVWKVPQNDGSILTEPKGDFNCFYCDFRSKCWGLNNKNEEEFDILKGN